MQKGSVRGSTPRGGIEQSEMRTQTERKFQSWGVFFVLGKMSETKKQIVEILVTIYQIPGEFFIAGIISKEIGKSMLSFTNYGYILIIFGIFCIVMEVISPLIAGIRLYEKAIENINKIFR